jgi:hypothetical protein
LHDVDEEDGDGEEGVSGVVVPTLISYRFAIVKKSKGSLD